MAKNNINDITGMYLFPNWSNQIGKLYDFVEELGRGGFGRVWKVRRLRDDMMFACKVMKKEGMKESTLKLIKSEVSYMEKLRHPRIVKFLEGFETSKRIYIVLELCTGGDLYDHIMKNKGTFKGEDICRIVKQLCAALAYCHQRNIIHCDLKPENIIFVNDTSTDIKLIDFGLSKVHKRCEWLSKVSGTPFYIAPECLSHQYDSAADIWSVGVLTFEMFHGYGPFEFGEDQSTVGPIREAAKGFSNTYKPGKGPWFNSDFQIPPVAKQFIVDLLKVNPAERPTAWECLQHPFLASDQAHSFFSHDHVFTSLHMKKELSDIQKFFAATISKNKVNHFLMKNMESTFKKYDVDRNGKLDWGEFLQALNELSTDHLDEFQFQVLFNEIDHNHDHQIDVNEFLQFCAYEHVAKTDDRIWDAVKILDHDKNGMIDASDIQYAIDNNPHILEFADRASIDHVLNIVREEPMDYMHFLTAIANNHDG